MVILVVEDEAIIGFCLTHVLKEAGHAVLGPALSANEALTLADAHPPDVALVDIDWKNPATGFVWRGPCASVSTASSFSPRARWKRRVRTLIVRLVRSVSPTIPPRYQHSCLTRKTCSRVPACGRRVTFARSSASIVAVHASQYS
jgi:DNA-binding NarL/FixJ family response regulator